MERSLHRFRSGWVSGITQSVSCAHRFVTGEATRPRRSFINTLARPQRATASPLRMVSRPFQVEVRRSEFNRPCPPNPSQSQSLMQARASPLWSVALAGMRLRRWRGELARKSIDRTLSIGLIKVELRARRFARNIHAGDVSGAVAAVDPSVGENGAGPAGL